MTGGKTVGERGWRETGEGEWVEGVRRESVG